MNRFLRFLLQAFAILVVATLAYGAYLRLPYLPGLIADLETTVIAAFVASLTAVFGYWYTQRQSKSREIAEAHRPEKVRLYRTFMDILERFLRPVVDDALELVDAENPPEDVQDMIFEFNRGLIVWGSAEMIETWLRFREGISQDGAEQGALLLMDDILRAIRNDLGISNLGISNAGLEKGDLVKIFLRAPEELDRFIGSD